MMSTDDIDYPSGCEPINANSKKVELVKRLKGLSEALRNTPTNEDVGNLKRYANLMLHLTEECFLSNKNEDVQLFLACCIADMFRILAPNLPIKESSRLKDILLFLTTVVGNFVDKEQPMYLYYVYLIENISLVETMQLALELGDDAYLILRQLIKQSLSKINVKNADEHIQGLLLGICSKLIQGVDQVSNIVLDAILFFIVQPQRMNNREAYRMARDLVRTNQTTLEPYISLLLKQGLESGILDQCELISQKKLYDLICELHKFAPEMIMASLPYLVNSLQSEDVSVRRETTRLFGTLFGSQNSRLAEDEPNVWKEYMKRFADVNEEIRCICVRGAEDILVFHPELRGQVTDAIILRSQDINENVRLEVLTTVQGLTKRKFEALSERLLSHVTDRIRDKKIKVRHAAIRGLSHLHRLVFTNDELTNLERFSVLGIFSSIMNHYYQPIPEDRLLTEKLFVSNLIPYKLKEDKRMEILVNIFSKLNIHSIKAVEHILTKQSFQRQLLHELVKFIDNVGASQKFKSLDDVVKRIIECSPEPARFSLAFRQFMEHLKSDRQLLLRLKYITGTTYTCQKVESATLEILQRLRSYKVSTDCMDVMKSLLECCAPLQFDETAVSVLIDQIVTLIKGSSDDERSGLCQRLIMLLKIVADAYPYCFVTGPTLDSLVEFTEIEDFFQMENLLSLVITISSELKRHEFLAQNMIDRYVNLCGRLSLDGTPRVAKYAVRCISSLLNEEKSRVKLTSILKDSLLHISASDSQCCTALKALSSCIEVDVVGFCNDEILHIFKTKIVALLLDQNDCHASSVALQQYGTMNDSQNEKERADGSIWDKNYLAVKKHSLKFVANFLASVAQLGECDIEPFASNLIKFYSTLLETKGDIFKKSCSKIDMAEFRALAGSSMLKLAAKPRYCKFITPEYLTTLSTLGYDEEAGVRHRFFGKLNKHLMAFHLHVEYMGLFALVALKEDVELRNRVRALVDANISKRRKYMEKIEVKEFAPYYQPEYCIAYAIYILSKIPSFKSLKCELELRRLTECIWFLLEIFSSRKEPGSVDFIFSIFKTVKNSTDSVIQGCTPEELLQKNEKIWALCDIGILLISYRLKHLIKDVACKPLLSKRFFLNMGRANNKVYAPLSFVEEIKTKKANIPKHQPTDLTQISAEVLNFSKKSVSRQGNQKTTLGSKRKQNEKTARNKYNKDAVEDTALLQEDSCDKTPNFKRPKFTTEEEQSQIVVAKQKVLGTKWLEKRRPVVKDDTIWGMEKEASPVRSKKPLDNRQVFPECLNCDKEPGTSKTLNRGGSPNISGSLEDCSYSPIRHVKGRMHNLTDSAVAAQKLPFTSSTPKSITKKKGIVLGDGENAHKANDSSKMATKEGGEVDIEERYMVRGGKMKKLCAVKTKKRSPKKTPTETKQADSISTRLRSRCQVATFSQSKTMKAATGSAKQKQIMTKH